jgi:hypothetical protein
MVGQFNWDRRSDFKILHDGKHVLATDKGGNKTSAIVNLDLKLSGRPQWDAGSTTIQSDGLYLIVCTEEGVTYAPYIA